MPHCFSGLVVKKDSLWNWNLTVLIEQKNTKKKKRKKEKKKWQHKLTKRQCFKSVVSTGYKLYFYRFWLMWSCLRKNTMNEQNSPGWTQMGLLSQLPDLSLCVFVCLSTYFVYLCKDTCDEWTLCLSFRAALGRDSAQESEQKFQQQAQRAMKHQTSVHCILYFKL